MELTGIHHVTAVTGMARQNLDFYTRVLGLRLVKKTVNQDVTSSYHLFYADGVGSPGTDMTFFDWPSVPSHLQGCGDVAATAFMVPEQSLDWWVEHLDRESVSHGSIQYVSQSRSIDLVDGEGQRLKLVEGGKSEAIPWRESPVPEEYAIRGLGAVFLMLASFEPTTSVFEKLLGFRPVTEYASPDDVPRLVRVFETGPGGLGTEVHLEERPDLSRAQVGVGGVHHVAFRTPDAAEHREWRSRIAAAHMAVTEVIDRYYFQSIYFREPGGVLVEIATDGPGFAQDEDVAHLGESLSLPPFLESRRAEIEAQLQPI
jgi:glyoxalase family protein